MMKPIYFPFTYIPDTVAYAIFACFKGVVVYQPSNRSLPAGMDLLVEQGVLDIRIPVEGDEHRLEDVCRSYYDWARLHQKNGMTFFRNQAGKVPFFDGTSAYSIRADILEKNRLRSGTFPGGSPSADDVSDADMRFRARVFLQLAQDFDAGNQDIHQGLQSCEKMHRKLFEDLKGDPELQGLMADKNGQEIPGGEVLAVSSADYRIEDRLAAWASLLASDHQPTGLFVTSSLPAFDFLIDKLPESQYLVDIRLPLPAHETPAISDGRERFLQYIEDLLEGAMPGDDIAVPDFGEQQGDVSLKLYRVPGKSPLDCFVGCIEDCALQVQPLEKKQACKNTVIGLIDLHP